MNKEVALIMAAGLGTRMLPLTEITPKPLVKVNGKPMIETIIEALQSQRELKQIFVVVGYKKEEFNYLTSKYKDLTIINNSEYKEKNNISSIYIALSLIENFNCFICEADLFIRDNSIFDKEFSNSCYFGKLIKGFSDDWAFDLDLNGLITRIGKGGNNCYNMVGISYFLEKDIKTLSEAIKRTYKKVGHESLFWDEVVNQQLGKIPIRIHPVSDGQIVEIDTLAELALIDSTYKKYLGLKDGN